MRFRRFFRFFPLALVLSCILGAAPGLEAATRRAPRGDDGPGSPPIPPIARVLLGKAIFFDTALSSPNGISCASCHVAEAGWADPRSARDPLNQPVSEGAVAGRHGPRNSLPVSYGDLIPQRFYDADCQCYLGGRYWDGRASNALQQAQDPFLNRLEMNNPSKHRVVDQVRRSSYAYLFDLAYGIGAWDNDDDAYEKIAEALVAFQSTRMFNRFTSRFDRHMAGDLTALTLQEKSGLALFRSKGRCTGCHTSDPSSDGAAPLFTTFRYYNIGVPKNPRNPFYDMPTSLNPDGKDYVDLGLGGNTGDPLQDGKFRVPSLRNVARTAPYMHNGVFTTLEEAVQFHNTRDVDSRWGPAEVPRNIASGPIVLVTAAAEEVGSQLDTGLSGDDSVGRSVPSPIGAGPGDTGPARKLGHLGLTLVEVQDIVAFLKTLNDE